MTDRELPSTEQIHSEQAPEQRDATQAISSEPAQTADDAYRPPQQLDDEVLEPSSRWKREENSMDDMTLFLRASQEAAERGDNFVAAFYAIFAAGERLGQVRRGRPPVRTLAPPKGGRWASRVFTCDAGVNTPSFVGWCHRGKFIGVAHVGSLAFAAITDVDI